MNNRWKDLLGLAFLAGLGVICSLLAASSIPLVDPDEGLHAAIAQRMVESGDWLVPRMLDEPFLDKPILYFWAIAASLKTFGMSEAAVRLPGLLFGMFGVLTTAGVAWRLLGRRTGLIAGAFYASMILPAALVQLPAHDVALVPWVNLALLCFWESDFVERNSSHLPDQTRQRNKSRSTKAAWAWTTAAGVVLGLSILTKGLAGVALVGIAYGGYLIVSRRLRFVHCLRAALALTVAALIGSSWYLAVEHAQPGFLHYYFFQRHVLGFLTKWQPHGAAQWWYYFPVLIVGGIPWAAYLPVLVQDTFSRLRRTEFTPLTQEREGNGINSVLRSGNRPLLLLGCWFVGCTLFLTLAGSKLFTYIWPVFPAMAILTAIVWARKIDGLLSDGAKRWMGRIVWCSCLLGPLGLPAALGVTQIAMPTQFSRLTWTLAVVAALSSLAPLWSWSHGRDRLTLGLAVTSVYGQYAVLLLCVLPQVAVGLSGRDFADYVNRSRELPARVFMAQERLGSLVFYLDRDLRSHLQPGQMVNLDIDDPLPSPKYSSPSAVMNWRSDEWIVIPERHLHTALNTYDLSSLPYEQAGRFRIYRRSELEPRAVRGYPESCRVWSSSTKTHHKTREIGGPSWNSTTLYSLFRHFPDSL